MTVKPQDKTLINATIVFFKTIAVIRDAMAVSHIVNIIVLAPTFLVQVLEQIVLPANAIIFRLEKLLFLSLVN